MALPTEKSQHGFDTGAQAGGATEEGSTRLVGVVAALYCIKPLTVCGWAAQTAAATQQMRAVFKRHNAQSHETKLPVCVVVCISLHWHRDYSLSPIRRYPCEYGLSCGPELPNV